MTVLILTISCLKFRLATHLKWVKGILVALCVMCVEEPLLQKRTLFHIVSQHAMIRRALIVIYVIRYSSLRKAWINTSPFMENIFLNVNFATKHSKRNQT